MHFLRVKYIEEISQNAYKGEGAVGTEKRSFPFSSQTDSPLG